MEKRTVLGRGEESGGDALSGEIAIDGSSTVFPIAQAAAEDFQTENPDVKISVGFAGTRGGFEAFCAGDTEISNASRPIEDEEVQCLEEVLARKDRRLRAMAPRRYGTYAGHSFGYQEPEPNDYKLVRDAVALADPRYELLQGRHRLRWVRRQHLRNPLGARDRRTNSGLWSLRWSRSCVTRLRPFESAHQ